MPISERLMTLWKDVWILNSRITAHKELVIKAEDHILIKTYIVDEMRELELQDTSRISCVPSDTFSNNKTTRSISVDWNQLHTILLDFRT